MPQAATPAVTAAALRRAFIAGARRVIAAREGETTLGLKQLTPVRLLANGFSAAVREAEARGATILPIDSEHNALHQALRVGPPGTVRRLLLTASGGPFRHASAAELERVTPEQAA